MNSTAVQCVNLSKTFGDTPALQHLTLDVRDGEILAVVGPSGCGKTTLLRLIAGFEQPDCGEIHIAGRLVGNPGHCLPPEARGVGMVFQDYALFPHLTVLENVAFGLRTPRAERERDANAILSLVGMEGYGDRFPHELSGGERQRVALARALAPQPRLVLLDEPFSNLDADRRVQMRAEVRDILKGLRTTAVFVTHDQEEALFMGDRLAVLNNGRLEQVDHPETVFGRPATRFVAEFMGQADFLPGEVCADGVLTEIGLLPQFVAAPLGERVEVALRADDVSFTPDSRGEARVLARYFKGMVTVYRLQLPSGQVLHALQPHTHRADPGTAVRVYADPGHDLACFYQGRAVETVEGARAFA